MLPYCCFSFYVAHVRYSGDLFWLFILSIHGLKGFVVNCTTCEDKLRVVVSLQVHVLISFYTANS